MCSISGEGVKPNTEISLVVLPFCWLSCSKLAGDAVVDDNGYDVVFCSQPGRIVRQPVSVASLEVAAIYEEQHRKTAGLRYILRSVDVQVEAILALCGVVAKYGVEWSVLVPGR